MSTLYWINVLDNILFVCVLIFILSLMFSLAFVLANLIREADEIPEIFKHKRFIKIKNWTYTLLIISTLVIIFILSQLYIIYGVGGTIDYLKDNPTAKELPDKCIKALDTWVDNLNKEGD